MLHLPQQTRIGRHWRIFEERYKEMINDVLREDGEFGVVFASEKGMANIGCTAFVEKVLKQYPDGRMDILARGRRRFEIILIDEAKNYLRASVALLSDEDTEESSDHTRQRVLSHWVKLMMLEHGGLVEEVPSDSRPGLSFLVAQLVPDTEFRQQLLAMNSEKDRMDALANFLPGYLEREKISRHVRRVAPLNGHASHAREVSEA